MNSIKPRNKGVYISLWVSEEEAESILQLASEAGTTRSSVVRSMIRLGLQRSKNILHKAIRKDYEMDLRRAEKDA